ncbi:hypothetical protein Poly51_41590 [Rubripirellula tenax]|uniref:Uncharacterized protein n=1 Tax=Rubripirellula tenax TaxID=2528015 RepID=A0A5C6ETD6_9BACT|nr:hypothetical protein [Rubripirellula tenax]TWU50866.1 hypothetical protein Poly51_41590 [Rubripirellula tenax]
MTPTPALTSDHEPVGLDIEDYRRLGVRPNELRVVVIRRAASRSTRSLARQLLNTHSSDRSVQLTRVATSAYRLMDPRLRTDLQQRAHVGRILPGVLRESTQTNFLNASEDGLTWQNATEARPSEDEEDANDWMPILDLGPIKQPVVRKDADAWLSTLSDGDLLETSSSTRRFQRIRRRLLPPWLWFVVGGLIVGTGWGIASVTPHWNTLTFRLAKTDSSPPEPDPSQAISRVDGQTNSTDSTTAVLQDPFVSNAETVTKAEILPPPISSLAIPPDKSQRPEATVVTSMVPSPMVGVSSKSASNPAKKDVSPVARPTKGPHEAENSVETTPGNVAAAENILSKIATARDGVLRDEIWNESLAFCERMLVEESFDPCKKVATKLSSLAAQGDSESRQRAVSEILEAAEQMTRMKAGMTKKSKQNESNSDNETAESIATLGRYQCLMLRQWNDDSLSRLSQSSDVRLASLARQELAIDTDAESDSLQVMAERWLNHATRSNGRAAESIQLHAIDLLVRSAATSDGLQRLEIVRKIDERAESLPVHLRPSTLATKPLRKTTPGAAQVREEADGVVGLEASGLRGRLYGGQHDEDLGVQINYQMDVAIKPSMLKTIASRLDGQPTPTFIRFTGVLDLDDETRTKVSIAPGIASPIQQVSIDGKPIQFDPLDLASEQTLPRGRHRIEWSIAVDGLSRDAFLGIHDAESGSRLPITAVTVDDDLAKRTFLTVAMLRNSDD